jgi:hypothetical protein
MKTRNNALSLMAVVLCAGVQVQAMGGSLLGSADGFAVLGSSTVTNAGPSVITGDLGVWPGTAVTGFPPGTLNGVLHAGGPVAMQAQSDLTTAYNALAGMPVDLVLTVVDLGGMTETPGVYFFASSAQLTGTLTLDFQGDPDARFVFQIGSTLITAVGSSVQTINGGDGSNVYWQVGSSATIGTNTAFEGNILALASITLNSGATILDGRALARNGAVTIASNTLTRPAAPVVCPADLNGNGNVGIFDLIMLLGAWGTPGPGDLDGNGVVNRDDIFCCMFPAWGPCP